MQLIYTQVSAKLREFISGIPSWGVPQKITHQELAALGFKSSNDRTILGVLKALDIVGPDGRPTEQWQGLRDREGAKTLLALLIRQAYSELYTVYPNAHAISDTQLKNFFSSRSKSGERAVQMAIATFKALVSLADFDSDHVLTADFKEDTTVPQGVQALPRRQAPSREGLSLTITLNVDASASPESIEALFRGLKDLSGAES